MNEDQLIDQILNSRKYRHMDIPRATVRDLLQQEQQVQRSAKEVVKGVKRKLHNVVAPYLGDPDYQQAAAELQAAYQSEQPAEIRRQCQQILAAHASTRERLPLLETFYQQLFEVTGQPASILDLACGLHPFSLPWMALPNSVVYRAYDIHQPRLDLINHFFQLNGLAPLAEKADILVNPPQEQADVAFFFKEAHRFEQRQKGCNRAFWRALPVRWLLVSLPSASLSGRHNLSDQQRRLVYGITNDEPWQVSELNFESEIVFCICKAPPTTS